MKKIAVIGFYGVGNDFVNGQAIKTVTIVDYLKEIFGQNEIYIVNTYKWKKNPIKLLLKLIKAMFTCKNITMLPAQNGLKVFAKLIYFFNRVFHRQIYYIVIGGWLNDMLIENKSLKNCISKFDGIYVETKSLQSSLKNNGIKNVFYMPNCRKQVIINKQENKINKLCIYSRIIKEKGIEDAINICRKTNNKLKSDIFTLDIYGKIDIDYKNEFQKLLDDNKDIVQYCGINGINDTIKTVSNYFAMLFPTFYEGECFAGTILDAFFAGIPIIANDWKYNSEIIENKVNGYVYSFRNIDMASNYIVELFNNVEQYKNICKNAMETSKHYTTEIVLKEFCDNLGCKNKCNSTSI